MQRRGCYLIAWFSNHGASVRALLAIICLTVSSGAHARDSFGDLFYVEAHGGIANIRVSDLAFRPIGAHVSVGGYFLKNIGVDLTVGGSLADDDDQGFDGRLDDIASLTLRLDSPPIDRLSAYILIGVSRYTIRQEGVSVSGISTSVTETFQGGTAALGFKRRIGDSRFSVVGVYRIHFVSEPVDVDNFSIGVRASWQ